MNNIIVHTLINSDTGYAIFIEQNYTLEEYNGMFITSRIDALNFRHRISEPGYFSSWHVAGDPTLIVVRSGILRIGLRDNSHRDFTAGDLFIASDRLPESGVFDQGTHGHTAEVIGDKQLMAIHIKLESI